jgi:hypothetical protein
MVVGTMNKKCVLGIAAACLLLAARWVVAEDQAPAPDQNAPRRILVAVEKGWIAGYSSEEMTILQRSFMTALSEAEGGPSPVSYGFSKGFPGSVKDRNKAARDAGADCWVLLMLSGFKGSPSIRVVSYDLIYDTLTFDFSTSRHEAFPIMDISRERWDDIVPLLAKKYPALGPLAYSRGPPTSVTVTLRAHPGTQITGLTPKPITAGPDGTASVDLPSPAPYSLRATLVGYVPAQMTFYLDGQSEIRVDQVKSPWLYLDGAFLDGFFPGVSATYAVPTFPGFVRVGFTSFRAGLAVTSDQPLASLPLSQITLLFGWYISPQDRPRRFYVGAGPLLRVTLPPEGKFTVDHLLPWGVQLVAGWEFPFAGRLHAFIEYAPTLYSTPEPKIFVDSFGSNNGSPNMTLPYVNFPPSFALNPFEVRFGLRWML